MHCVKYRNEEIQIPVGKILCIGRNYAEHAREFGNQVPSFPIVFLKPPSCIIGTGGAIEYPEYSVDMQHEVELVLLVGKKVRKCGIAEAEDAVEGYAVGLDMTLRDLQSQFKKNGEPWTFAKCFDTSAAVSEFTRRTEVKYIMEEVISLSVNGILRQQCSLSDMIFKPADIISYISDRLTLYPGDLIYTGTPKGVSSVNRGDIITAGIGSCCKLEVTVK